MSRKFISYILAAAVAVSGLSAAPAQASDRDVARALAAIAGIAIIGAAIHDNNKKKKRRHQGYVSSRGHNDHGYRSNRQHRSHKRAQRQHRQYRQHRRNQRANGHRYGNNRGYGQHRYNARPRYGN